LANLSQASQHGADVLLLLDADVKQQLRTWTEALGIGLVGKILTGLSPIIHGKIYGFQLRFSLKPIH